MEDLQERGIGPSICGIIDGILNRRIELEDVYEDVYAALSEKPRALYIFWDASRGRSSRRFLVGRGIDVPLEHPLPSI